MEDPEDQQSTVPLSTLSNPSPVLVLVDEADDSTTDDGAVKSNTDSSLDDYRSELFSAIRYIQDPEHQLTLEQLGVVKKKLIHFKQQQQQQQQQQESAAEDETSNHVIIEFIPTVPHCSLATTIGLCLRTKLEQDFPDLKLEVRILSGRHLSGDEINKQLNDKERCCAAMENPAINQLIQKLINQSFPQ